MDGMGTMALMIAASSFGSEFLCIFPFICMFACLCLCVHLFLAKVAVRHYKDTPQSIALGLSGSAGSYIGFQHLTHKSFMGDTSSWAQVAVEQSSFSSRL